MTTDPKREILLNPGPVNLSDRVRRAMTAPDMCHREQEYDDLLQDVRRKLLLVYDLDPAEFAAVVLAGSGTAAVESALCAAAAGGKALVVSNGVYGERMGGMAEAYGIEHAVLQFDWGETIDLARVESDLVAGDFSVLATIHHETTTGVLNDVAGMAEVARKHGASVVVDGVSSFAGEDLDFANLDFAAGTANKCIHGIPGACFVVARRESVARNAGGGKMGVYLDLQTHLEAQDKGEPAFTPAIPAVFVLREALDELLETGVPERIAEYRRRSSYIRERMAGAGFAAAFPGATMSSTLSSFVIPESLSYERIHDYLKEEGFVIYAGQGRLRKSIFRIANMGELHQEDLERLCDLLERLNGGQGG